METCVCACVSEEQKLRRSVKMEVGLGELSQQAGWGGGVWTGHPPAPSHSGSVIKQRAERHFQGDRDGNRSSVQPAETPPHAACAWTR